MEKPQECSTLRVALAVLASVFAAGAMAQASVKGCNDDAFLTIGGNIAKHNTEVQSYEYSEEEFNALPATIITTGTTWTKRSSFRGPTITEVLKHVGAFNGSLKVTAMNRYVGVIPRSKVEKFNPILATSRNDVRLTVKDSGPMFVIFPRDDYPTELNTPTAQNWYVWQVCRIDVVR